LHPPKQIGHAVCRQSLSPSKENTVSRLLISCCVSWLVLSSAAPARADEAEDNAVAFVKIYGGKVIRDETRPGKPVVEVYLTRATDADVKVLTALKGLTTITLWDSYVTDTGVKNLLAFKNLTSVTIRSDRVTDKGVKDLVLD
jgi:hypothetical protein